MNMNAFYDTLQEYAEQVRVLVENLLALSVLVGVYAATRIGLYLLARRRGIPGAWTAWLPIGAQIVLSKLSAQYRSQLSGQKKQRLFPVVYIEVIFFVLNCVAAAWFTVILMLLMFSGLQAVVTGMVNLALLMFGGLDAAGHLQELPEIPTHVRNYFEVGMVLLPVLLVVTAVRTVFNSRFLLDVYRSCQRRSAKAWLTLGILFPPLKPVFLFLCAKNQMKEENLI